MRGFLFFVRDHSIAFASGLASGLASLGGGSLVSLLGAFLAAGFAGFIVTLLIYGPRLVERALSEGLLAALIAFGVWVLVRLLGFILVGVLALIAAALIIFLIAVAAWLVFGGRGAWFRWY